MKKLEKEVIIVNLKRIGEFQRRIVRGDAISINYGWLIKATNEKLILDVFFNYIGVTNQRPIRVCYFYVKDANSDLPFQGSKYALNWKKLDLQEDIVVDGRKMEVYAVLY